MHRRKDGYCPQHAAKAKGAGTVIAEIAEQWPGESEGSRPVIFDATAGWNLEKEEDRKGALLALEEVRPFLVVGSLPSGVFEVMGGVNQRERRANPKRYEEKIKQMHVALEFLGALA